MYLMVVEYDVGISILAGNCVCPELLHEEDLIHELERHAVLCGPRFLDPVRQVTHKIEEKVALRHADN